jgi:hypothetical protein
MPRKKPIGSPAITPNQDEGAPYPGRIPQILDRPAAPDLILERMRRLGMTIDRENYIWCNWGADPPEWTAELEAELPEELRDWSQFE